MSNSNTNSPSGTGTGTGTGTTPSHANPLDLEEEDYTTFQDLDSDSEGGMQLDPPELTFHLAGSEIQYDTHAWEETRDESHLSTLAPSPSSHGHGAPARPGGEERSRVVRPRHRLREEEHAALAILDDWELLVTYAVKNGLTIPQARRRFTAKLLAPENPSLEEELYGARFVIPASKSELLPGFLDGGGGNGGRSPELATGTGNATAYLVPASWKEILTEEEDGWWGVGRGPKQRSKVSRERVVSGNNGSRIVSGESSSV